MSLPIPASGFFNIGTGAGATSLPFGFDPAYGFGIVLTFSGRTTNGVARANVQMGYGIAGCSNGGPLTVMSVSGASVNTGTSACASGQRDDVVIHAIDTAGGDAGQATIALTQNGCMITPVSGHTFTNDLVVHWWAVPIEALATLSAAEPATATTSQTSGLPWDPAAGIVPLMGNVSSFSSPSQTATDFNLSFGVFCRNPSGVIQNAVMGGWSDSGLATTVTKTYFNMSECLARGDSTAGNTPRARASCTAMGGGTKSFTWTYAAVEGAGTHQYPVLLFRKGLWAISQFTAATNTSTPIVITPGFAAQGLLTCMSGNTVFNTIGTASGTARHSVGMAGGSGLAGGQGSQHGMCARDTNGQVGAVCTVGSDNANCVYSVINTGPATEQAAKITSIGPTTTSFLMTTAPASAFVGFVLSVNVGATGAPQYLPRQSTFPQARAVVQALRGPRSYAAAPLTAGLSPQGASSEELPGAVVLVSGEILQPLGARSEELVGASSSAATASATGAPSSEAGGPVQVLAGYISVGGGPSGSSEEKPGAPSASARAVLAGNDSEELPGAVTLFAGVALQPPGAPSNELVGAAATSATATAAGAASEERTGAVVVAPALAPAGAGSGEVGGAATSQATGAPAGGASSEQGGAPLVASRAAPAGAVSSELVGSVQVAQGSILSAPGAPSEERGGAVTTGAPAAVAGAGSSEIPGTVQVATGVVLSLASAPSMEAGGAIAAAPALASASGGSTEMGGAARVTATMIVPGSSSNEALGAVLVGQGNTVYCYPPGAPSEERGGAIVVTGYSIPPWLIAGPGTSATYSLVLPSETFSIIVDADTED